MVIFHGSIGYGLFICICTPEGYAATPFRLYKTRLKTFKNQFCITYIFRAEKPSNMPFFESM